MPMLDVESRGDLRAPNEMAARLGPRLRTVVLPGDDHHATLREPAAIDAVRDFLETCATRRSAGAAEHGAVARRAAELRG
jgi:hypothetical protein